MKPIIILFAATSFTSCAQSNSHKWTDKTTLTQSSQKKFDSSNTAFIPFKNASSYLFDISYLPTTLTVAELAMASDTDFVINLESNRYKRQIVAVINGKGEKEIWINCFC